MKGSLEKLKFVCSTFLKTFCTGHNREGVKFNYDLPMDAKQHAWTTEKGSGYLVFSPLVPSKREKNIQTETT